MSRRSSPEPCFRCQVYHPFRMDHRKNVVPQNLMDTMESMKKAVAVLESEAGFFGGTRCWLVGVRLVPEKIGMVINSIIGIYIPITRIPY